MDKDLEKVIYEAMKAGNKGISENEIYEVKFVGKMNGNDLIAEKVKVKFKESGLKVDIPIKLFLTNNELDKNSVSLLAGAIQVLYVPVSVCNLS